LLPTTRIDGGAYSLLSAPVLGYDLTRLTGGAATAEVLLRGLCLVPEDLPVLAAQLPDPDTRHALWLRIQQASLRRLDLVTAPGHGPHAVRPSGPEHAPIGSVDALLRLVRDDVLGWTWSGALRRQREPAAAATALVCDAAVSAYLGDELAAPVRHRLGAGWQAARARLPAVPPIDLGPYHDAISGVLQRVCELHADEVGRLVRSARQHHARPGGWSRAVHSASCAAHLAGRVSTAAAAQLLLVQALAAARVPLADRATGVWHVLSGAVQALVVRDLLDSATVHRLLAPAAVVLHRGSDLTGLSWLD
jgi:hypothetical protein